MPTNKTVDSWLSGQEPGLREIAEALRQIILEACPEITETIKWGNPVYQRNGLVCYLAATKAYVSLGFFNGAGLEDHEGRMEGTGKKMRHVKVRNKEGIHVEYFASWLREAVRLNQQG